MSSATRSSAASRAPPPAHGGHETTLLALYNTMHHRGSVIVPAGYAGPELFAHGNPYGVSVLVTPNGPREEDLAAVRAYAQRVVYVGAALPAPAAAA